MMNKYNLKKVEERNKPEKVIIDGYIFIDGKLKNPNTDDTFEAYRENLRAQGKYISSSKERSRQFLKNAGIIDDDGKLSEFYR